MSASPTVTARIASIVLMLTSARGGVAAEALHVEYTGCQSARAGPLCVVKPNHRMVLWIDVDRALRIQFEGGKQLAEAPVLGGRQFLIELDRSARELNVRAADRAPWTLTLEPPAEPTWLLDANAALNQGDLETARTLATPHSTDPSDAYRSRAIGVLARAAMQSSAWSDAEGLLRDGMLGNDRAGYLVDASRDRAALVWILIERGRWSDASSLIDDFPAAEDLPGDVHYLHDYYAGLLASEIGDVRRAFPAMASAEARAERLDLNPERSYAQQILDRELGRVGRPPRKDDAPPASSPCDRAQFLANKSWERLLECEAGPCTPPLAELEQVVNLYTNTCTDRPSGHLNALVNLALGYYDAGQPEAARAALAHARELDPDPPLRYVVWQLDVAGRLALQGGDPQEALQQYAQMEEAAARLGAPEARWRAAVGRARVRAALHDADAAIAAYEAAESLLASESELVPLQEGRDSFVARRERATREYVTLLMDHGDQARAFSVARRARARVLRSARVDARLTMLAPGIERYVVDRDALEQQSGDLWKLSGSERATLERERVRLHNELLGIVDAVSLAVATQEPASLDSAPPIPDQTVVLSYYPLVEGWVGFAADSRGVVASRVGSLETLQSDPAALAGAVLTPFATRIQTAASVRFLPYGLLRQLDLQTLAFQDRPLIAMKPVSFSLDLASAPAQGADGEKLALLVADPTGDLPASIDEVNEIARSLDPTWRVQKLIGEEATGAALRSWIPRATLFHYAGHAIFRGHGGWDSELPLAGNTSLGIDDILAFERVPQWVVLSGCEAARSDADIAAEGMGLAQAFLIAGSTTVIAPIRPVADDDAAALTTSLYAQLRSSSNAVVALQQASVELQNKRPQTDWASFRAVER